MVLKLYYQVIVHRESGGFWAEFPYVEGCYGAGDTEEEALQDAGKALRLFIKSCIKRGLQLPISSVFEYNDRPEHYILVTIQTAIAVDVCNSCPE